MARTDARPNYGLGRRVRPDGYVDLWAPGHPMARCDGYAFEHRVIAFDAGLLTDPAMHVHHISGNKQDNRLANLEVLTIVKHAQRHAAEDGYITNQFGTWPLRESPRWPAKTPRPCAGCENTIPTTRRRDALYCTDQCRVNTFKRNARKAPPAVREVAAA